MLISFKFKNDILFDSFFYEVVDWIFGLLRVMELVWVVEGDGLFGVLYVEYGCCIYYDKEWLWDLVLVFEVVGFDVKYVVVVIEELWDMVVRVGMDEGLVLVGVDVGMLIIVFYEGDREVVVFGLVIIRVLVVFDNVCLWDVFCTVVTMDGFWEIKRTCIEGLDFGDCF